jgi:hypothetical protein
VDHRPGDRERRPGTDPASAPRQGQIATAEPSARPPARGRSGLSRARRIVDAGPRYFSRSALASFAVTCLLVIPIALSVRPHDPRPQQATIAAALAGLCVATLLGLAATLWPPGRRGRWPDRIAAPEQRAAIWLALTVWFPLLLVVAYFGAQATIRPATAWINFGYLDKRWVTSAYLVGAFAPMLLLVAAARVLAAGREHPETWRSWLSGLAPQRAGAGPSAAPATRHAGITWHRLAGAPAARITAGILTSLATAWYLYGPPWYLGQRGAPGIGMQEDVFLSGFQAISKGAIPYIGPASVQYGPGAQLLSYLYMRHIGTFSVVGFRESWAAFEVVGAAILFAVFFIAFGYLRGLIATLLTALIYPALPSMGFMPGGSFNGLFGWTNPLRYAGSIALILLFPRLVRLRPARKGLAGAVGLGLLFGGMSYVAQENLIAGVVGVVAVGALLVLTGTSSIRSVATKLLAVLAGFLALWVPVLAYYQAHGVAGRFLQLYFLFPRAVASGYSNVPFGGSVTGAAAKAAQADWDAFFYGLPFILAVLALLVVVQFRPFRVAWEWADDRVALAAILISTILLYQGALLRSDESHLYGTMLVVPGLSIMTATLLPRLLGAVRPLILAVAGVAIFAGSLLLLPSSADSPARVLSLAAAPYQDRARLAAEPTPTALLTPAGSRVGAGLAAAPQCCQYPGMTMPDLIAFMNKLHAIIGNRTAYVVRFPDNYPGAVYFVADLRPAPVPIDVTTMVITGRQYVAYLRDFRSSVLPRTGALVTVSLDLPQVNYFRHRYANARVISLRYLKTPVYVLLRSG